MYHLHKPSSGTSETEKKNSYNKSTNQKHVMTASTVFIIIQKSASDNVELIGRIRLQVLFYLGKSILNDLTCNIGYILCYINSQCRYLRMT